MKVTKSSPVLAALVATTAAIGAGPSQANPAAAIVLAGVALASGTTLASEAAPETITIAQETDPLGFDIVQVRVSNQTTTNAALPVMEGLFAFDENGKIVSRLGTGIAVSDDRLSAVVTLREGVAFHDGTPFNADAVAAHYNRILDPQHRLSTRMFSPLKSVEAVSEHEVQFNLHEPWVALKPALALNHLYNFIPSPTAIQNDSEAFNTHPIGTGPFKFQSWDRDERVVFTRNEDYWDPGLPKVDRLVIRNMPDNQTRLAALRAGEIDVMKTPSPSQMQDFMDGNDGIQLLTAESHGVTSWNLNQAKAPFDDPEVRKAVVQAIDGEAINKAYFKGLSNAVQGLFNPSSEWFCEDADWTSYDPDAAKAVVEEKGGISFELQSINSPAGKSLATFMEYFLSNAGFDVKVDLVEQGKNIRDGILGDYDMNIWRYTGVEGDPDLLLSNNLRSPATNHDTEQYEALLSKARGEEDPQRRKDIYCDIQNLYAKDNLFVLPVQALYGVLARDEVKNLTPPVSSQVEVRNLTLQSD